MPTASTDPYAGPIHGLDAYRGVLMSLGVVRHTGLFFPAQEVDGGTEGPFSLWMTPIMWTTHTTHLLRMPAFLVLSGFLGALPWKRRGARGTHPNRFERLLLPLVVLSILVIPVMNASFAMFTAYSHGETDVFAPVIETLAEASWLPDLWHL